MFEVDLTRLREAMEDAELDQSALARSVGCTPGAINQIALGNVRRSRLLPEIARALGVDLDWLAGADREKRRAGVSNARLKKEEYELLDDVRAMRLRDRQSIQRIAEALRTLDDVDQGHVPLPSEQALEQMFAGLLDGIDPAADRDELARLLAQRLPIGLSQLRDLLPASVSPANRRAAAASAPEDPATLHRAPTP